MSENDSLKRIIELGNHGNYCYFKKMKGYDKKDVLEDYRKAIKRCIDNTAKSKWDLAIEIALLLRSGSWVSYYRKCNDLHKSWQANNPDSKIKDSPYFPFGGMSYCTNTISFFAFLMDEFGLGRTSVYNFLEVVDKFTHYNDEKYTICQEAKYFQFWQLVEMLPLSYQERLVVQSNWTREQIREYKKSLKEKSKIQPAEFECSEIEEELPPDKYTRFEKFTKTQLIDRIYELEEEIRLLKQVKV